MLNGGLAISELTPTGRMKVLITALLGWMFAGMVMAIGPLVGRAATTSMLISSSDGEIAAWFSRYACSFLLGAAAGGLLTRRSQYCTYLSCKKIIERQWRQEDANRTFCSRFTTLGQPNSKQIIRTYNNHLLWPPS